VQRITVKETRFSCESHCRSNLLHVIFTPAEKRLLRGQTFQGWELIRIGFSNADLRGANFARATFGWTRLDDSWLIGARGLSNRVTD
jgi:uncharacterized protein YjbI with pentapeptide repeats